MNIKKQLKRTIENDILKWYQNKDKRPLLLNGMRQVGKTTTILNFLEEHCSNNYIKLNLLEEKDKQIFENSGSYEEILINIEASTRKKINEETIIFIDEVQESKNAYYFIKLANDNPAYNNNLICSGSYINNHVLQNGYKVAYGSYQELIMYPLTFYEYALNKGLELEIKHVESAINNRKRILTQVHNKLLSVLDEYILIGGMPAIVSTYLEIGNLEVVISILSTLQDQQRIDIQRGLNKASQGKVLQIYDSIKNTFNRTEGLEVPKLMFSDIDKESKARYSKYKNELEILLRSNILTPIYQINDPYINNTDSKKLKLVYSDMGFLAKSIGHNNLEQALKNKELILGYITENFVALELQTYHSPKKVKYWYKPKIKNSKSTVNPKEIDFIYNGLPIDVKAGTNANASPSMKEFNRLYNPKYSIIISRKNFTIDHDAKRIKLPLYALWMLKRIIEK